MQKNMNDFDLTIVVKASTKHMLASDPARGLLFLDVSSKGASKRTISNVSHPQCEYLYEPPHFRMLSKLE